MYLMKSSDMLSSFSFSELLGSAVRAMIDEGNAAERGIIAPLRSAVARGEDSLLLMPCLTREDWGLKVLTLFPENPGRGKPFINGLFLLFDGEDGTPAALLDGRTLTALRTGAVGGAGMNALAPSDVKTLGLLGAGVQGYWQVRFACSVRSFSEVRIYDLREKSSKELADRLAADLPGVSFSVAESSEHLLRASEAIITATNSTTPLFPEKPDLFRDRTFVAIGSYTPEMREYPDSFFSEVDRVYVDTLHALDETGDLMGPLEAGTLLRKNISPLADILPSGGYAPVKGKSVLFKSVGLSVFDLYAARTILSLGREKKQGQEFSL